MIKELHGILGILSLNTNMPTLHRATELRSALRIYLHMFMPPGTWLRHTMYTVVMRTSIPNAIELPWSFRARVRYIHDLCRMNNLNQQMDVVRYLPPLFRLSSDIELSFDGGHRLFPLFLSSLKYNHVYDD